MKRKKESHSHLTLYEREIILVGIQNRSPKNSVAKTIGKDPTTVAKEIRKHRELRPRNVFNYPSICIHRVECKKCNKIENRCSKYEEPYCKWRDRTPGACNNCPSINTCRLDKYFYSPLKAQKEYEDELRDSREGVNLTNLEAQELANTLKPLLDQKQSIYQIKVNHPEIKQKERTLYGYIEKDILKEYGINHFSLKEKVQRKRSKNKLKKRKEPVNYTGRKYEDYLNFMKENPEANVIQLDTVYNIPSGPYIETLKFKKEVIQIGFIYQKKDNESMSSTFDLIEEKFGSIWFKENIPVILTDRGPEFEKWHMYEKNNETGEHRCKIFYCDPQQSSQKPDCEVNHNYVRDILPNEMDLSLLTQEDMNLVFSHINSTPRKSLNGKTPYELAEFIHGKEFLDKLNIKKIDPDEVTLSPDLLRKK